MERDGEHSRWRFAPLPRALMAIALCIAPSCLSPVFAQQTGNQTESTPTPEYSDDAGLLESDEFYGQETQNEPSDQARTNSLRPRISPIDPDDNFSPYTHGNDWQTFHPAQSDPFGAIGLRAGSFVIYPELIVQSVHNDNIFLSDTDQKTDHAVELRPTIEIESDWTRHALRADFRGTFNYHDEYGSEDEKSYFAGLKSRIDLSRRTNLEAELSYDLSQEGRSDLDFPGGAAERTDIERRSVGGAFNHRFNRLSVSVRGSVSEIDYGQTPLTGGGIDTNNDRDYEDAQGALRLTYDFKPGFAVFAEGELGERNYKTPFDDAGFNRSSERSAFRGGVMIDIGPKLRGELGVGHAWQSPDDIRLADVDGFVLDAQLRWQPRQYTAVTFTARSDIEETSFGAASAIFERYYAAEIRHALRRHLIVTANIAYESEDYEGTDTTQNTLGIGTGAEYILSRRAALIGTYAYTMADGKGAAQNYHENEFRLGLRLRP